jgi:WD40 repeat protein
MKQKQLPPLFLATVLAFLSLNCGTLDLRLENPKSTNSAADTILGKGQTGSTAMPEIIPSEGANLSTPASALPTSSAAANIYAAPKTILDVSGGYTLWSSDGKWLVIGGRKIHFYDAQSLKEVRSIQADRWVVGLAISPDSKILAAIDESRGVMLFDLASGSELRTLPRTHISTSAASNSFLAFSPDSATLAVIIGDVVKLFRVSTGEETGTLIPKAANDSSYFSPDAIAFAADGKSLYAGGDGIAVVNVTSGNQMRSFGSDTNHMALSPDGAMLLSAGHFANQPITLWEAATGRQLRTFTEPTMQKEGFGVTSVAFSPDGKFLATAADDVTIRLWDVPSGNLLQKLVGQTHAPASMAFSHDGSTLATASGEEDETGNVRLWSISSGGTAPKPTASISKSNSGTSVRPTSIPLSGRAISADNAKQVKQLSILDVSESGNLLWSPDGKSLVISGRKIHFYDSLSLKETNALAFETGGLAITPDNKILAAAAYQGVTLFDMNTGSELRTLPRTNISTSALSNSFLAFTPDSATLAVIIGDVVKLYSVASGEETSTIVAKGAYHIFISPDGRTLYAVGWGEKITAWDMDTGQQIRSIGNTSISLDNMILSPDGGTLATCSFDGSINLWDAATGHQLRSFSGSQQRISQMAFSPDGQILASVSNDVTINLWNATTGELLTTLVGHSQSIKDIAISPDGARLASSSYSDGVFLWGLPG